ncbi:MAG TPA: hypothetical protein DCX54_04315 [Flavobacteriales bacterium]|nr:hypothetical protein [Flavobacteriales bacterium]
MKLQILIVIQLFFCATIFGQKIHVVHDGIETDSSFYHLTKINENEFWIGGEYGILKKIDSSGTISQVNYPNDGLNILKVLNVDNYVYVVTANSVIYRFNTTDQTCLKKSFPRFKNRCFYDVISLKNGNLLVCGGTTGIQAESKTIPNGFIALLDKDLEEMEPVWKSYHKFVWSLLEMPNGEILASTFNGNNSKIIKSSNYSDWKKDSKVKGLIHELALLDGEVYYSGARSFRFRKDGIFGIKDKEEKVLNGTGCLWSMDSVDGNVISVTSNNKLVLFDTKKNEVREMDIPISKAMYDIQKISKTKILVVGHAQSMYFIDLPERQN